MGGKQYVKAVDGVSLEINKGETFGLVGESGCGKSTLERTLIRMYDITDGKVTYKGKDITNEKAKNLQWMKDEVQIIFQDPYSSLNPRMSVGQIISEGMQAHNMIKKKDARMQQLVLNIMDECGLAPYFLHRFPHQFSGGQRQRVSLARAFLKNAPILVLDEATASLDMKSEEQIQKEIEKLASGRTTFIIAHRFSTIRMADRILVLEKGSVVADGTHEELMASSPLYRELYNKQQMIAEEEGGASC